MVRHRDLITEWAGDRPLAIHAWHETEVAGQYLIRQLSSVSILDLRFSEEIEEHAEAPTLAAFTVSKDAWSPGSIQAYRNPDGSITVKHRLESVILESRADKSPSWVADLLEDWLGGDARDRANSKRSQLDRLRLLNREVDSVRRIFSSADVEPVAEASKELDRDLVAIEARLADEVAHHS